MGRPFALNRLPRSIREELLTRRADKPGLTLDDHAAWLTDLGHQVSRSSIYRFLEAHDAKQHVTADAAEPTDAKSIRLGCLMVAAGVSTPGDKVDLLNTAEELLIWVDSQASE
ncbi:DUF3486 family protein [Ectopseudomonas hydrolytica]|uniref:DUF3486 family protein n=1 Tax=Ectopseudomonas hydrolytica TaxID=2493633 RepID=A0ABY5A2I6_9GAMM|nr:MULTISPECIES: DUF3486 family protein [Pseudomonas]USR38078.1 DUF3486 family protein [Pseudomonas hydrolytica]